MEAGFIRISCWAECKVCKEGKQLDDWNDQNATGKYVTTVEQELVYVGVGRQQG